MNRKHDDHALTAHADQNDEDRADRSVGLTQPPVMTPERRRRHDPGDAEHFQPEGLPVSALMIRMMIR